ncbi:MAG: ribonuclease P protein component [bacterium]
MPSKYKLRNPKTITKCMKSYQRKTSKFFILKKNDSFETNFVIIVSKKAIKKATQRNKLKRRIRHIIKINIINIPKGNYCIIAKNNISFIELSYSDINADILEMFDTNSRLI